MIFYFKVSGDCLELIDVKDRAYSGNVNSYICRFELDSNWQGLDCFATFGTGDKFYTVVVTSSGEAVIPEEALLAGETLMVGLFGTNAGGENYVRLSTGFAEIQVGQGAYIPDATAPALPAPDVWEELICRNIPKIGENGNWYIWDISSGEYRDSGVSVSGDGVVIPDGVELKANKVTEITENSTDEEYPSAKAVYELVGDIESVLAQTVEMQSFIIGDPTMPASEVDDI